MIVPPAQTRVGKLIGASHAQKGGIDVTAFLTSPLGVSQAEQPRWFQDTGWPTANAVERPLPPVLWNRSTPQPDRPSGFELNLLERANDRRTLARNDLFAKPYELSGRDLENRASLLPNRDTREVPANRSQMQPERDDSNRKRQQNSRLNEATREPQNQHQTHAQKKSQAQRDDTPTTTTTAPRRSETDFSSDQARLATEDHSPSSKTQSKKSLTDAETIAVSPYAVPPVLYLLSGQLQMLEPATIPGLVTRNDFLQEALANADLQNYLQSPQPMGQILQKLGVPIQSLAATNLQSADFNQPISPLALFDQLGFNSQSMANELNLLVQNLPIDGVNPYMIRSAALRQQFDPQTIPSETETSAPWALSTNELSGLNQPTSGLLSQAEVRELEGLIGSEDANQSELLQNQASEQIPAIIAGLRDLLASQGEGTQISIQDSQQSGQSHQPNEALNLDSIDASSMPQATPSSSDPMQAIENEWLSHSIIRWQDLEAAPTNIDDTGSEPGMQDMQQPSDMMTASIEDAAANISPEDMPDSQISQFRPSSTNPNKLGSDQALGALGKEALTSVGDSSSNNKDFRGDSQTSSQNQDWQWTSLRHSPQVNQTNASAPLTQSVESSSSQRSEWIHRLMDKAQMLVKEGGGSIRLDVGDTGLGKVDIALDVKDKTIELKIMAANDQARDTLVADLPRLKEALQQQNLDLKLVEVGTRAQQQWSGQSSDGSQHQGHQSFQSQQRFSEHGYSSLTERRVQSQSYRPVNRNMNPNGQIAVRV